MGELEVEPGDFAVRCHLGAAAQGPHHRGDLHLGGSERIGGDLAVFQDEGKTPRRPQQERDQRLVRVEQRQRFRGVHRHFQQLVVAGRDGLHLLVEAGNLLLGLGYALAQLLDRVLVLEVGRRGHRLVVLVQQAVAPPLCVLLGTDDGADRLVRRRQPRRRQGNRTRGDAAAHELGRFEHLGIETVALARRLLSAACMHASR